MSNTNNGPPRGTPSPELQKGLIIPPPSNLHARHARGGLHQRAESQQGITPQFVLTAIRQWWRVATPAALVLAVIAGVLVYYCFTKPQYEASALLQIREERPYLAYEQSDNWTRFVETQKGLMQNRVVLAEVVKEPKVARVPELTKRSWSQRLSKEPVDQVRRLQEGLRLDTPKGSELLKISFTSSDAESSAVVVNAVQEEYIRLHKKRQQDRTQDVVDLLEAEKLARLAPTGKVARAREDVRRLTKQATGKDPFRVANDPDAPADDRVTEMHMSLVNTEVEREISEAKIKALEESFIWLGSAGTTSGGGSATVSLVGDDNDLVVKPAERDSKLEGVNIVFVKAAVGDQAVVTFDADTRKLTIGIDPDCTTANTVIASINAEGNFTAELDTTADRFNDGTGRIGDGLLDIRAGTTAASEQASAQIELPGEHNDLKVSANEAGPAFDNIQIAFVNSIAMGDQAIAAFDKVAGSLTIDIDPMATTANAVIKAIGAEGTFKAELGESRNDGTGLIGDSVLGTRAETTPASGRASAQTELPGKHNDLMVTAAESDLVFDSKQIVFVNDKATGDQAIARFDKDAGTLTIDIDPKATTVNTVIKAIGAERTFAAKLLDKTTDGTGLIADSGHASAQIELPGECNDLMVTAAEPGPVFDNIQIVFVNDKAMADQAKAKFDKDARTLTIDIDPKATTAQTVINAICAERTFEAKLLESTGLISKRQVEVPDGLVERAVGEHPEVQRLAGLLSAARARLSEIEARSAKGREYSSYKQVEKEVAQVKETLKGLRADLRQQLKAEGQVAEISRHEDELASLKAGYEELRIREKSLRDRYDAQLRKLKEYSGETLKLVFAKAEMQRAEDVLKQIEARITTLRTETKAPTRVELVQAAVDPTVPEPRWRLPLLAALIALCLPFGLAVLWERIIRRVTDARQIEQHSDLAVVGEVARLPVRTAVLSKSSSKRVGRSLGIFEESIDTLRTCLVLSEPLKDMKVLAVTSSTNNEGKTSVAVQLAVSIARASGEPTLLIDGDMRSPDIHNVLGISSQPGLGDVLAKQCSLEDAIVTDWSDSVHVLPAGKIQSSPHKLLGNGILGTLFAEVRSSYRYVVVDTPPVLAASEALVLASSADAALVCAMRDVSRVDQIKRTHERLLTAGAHPVGIVLNGISAKRYTYRYGNYAYSQE